MLFGAADSGEISAIRLIMEMAREFDHALAGCGDDEDENDD
jgi:hypothetical protein